ncbi:MAG: cation transporter [Chitinophagales bacterium]|nr:cation transporter [Chitinophagales bacterium]
MKRLILFISIIFCSISLFAQQKEKTDVVTETYMVSGNCGECKSRIEKAAYVKGVKRADWNKETKKLTVTYKSSKTSGDEILKSIADAGYDSEKVTASDDAYAKLPACCNYRTGTCGD